MTIQPSQETNDVPEWGLPNVRLDEILKQDTRSSRERRLRVMHEILVGKGRIAFAPFFERIKARNQYLLSLPGGDSYKVVKDLNRTAFSEDIAELKFVTGMNIVKVEDGTYVAEDIKFATTRQLRTRYQHEAKLEIARLCGGLLLGDTSPHDDTLGMGSAAPELQHELKEKLSANNKCGNVGQLIEKLTRGVWNSYQRMVGCDAGTTTFTICNTIFAKLKMPRGSLNRLYVCTNSRHIFEVLAVPEVNTKAIIVGGGQQSQSEAISGWMSQKFMEAANLRFAISFVGAVSVDVGNWTVGADHDNDCAMKNEFLSRSEIKVIVADHSKFTEGAYIANLPFAQLNSETIDLIVTDKISSDHLKKLNSKGIPVLSGNYKSEEN